MPARATRHQGPPHASTCNATPRPRSTPARAMRHQAAASHAVTFPTHSATVVVVGMTSLHVLMQQTRFPKVGGGVEESS